MKLLFFRLFKNNLLKNYVYITEFVFVDKEQKIIKEKAYIRKAVKFL